STITLGGRIENRGTAAALGSWFDRAYLSTDAVLNQNDALLGELAHAGPLAAGGGYDVSFNVPLPVDASGIRYLLLVGDATNQVNELGDERNNLARNSLQVQLAPYADLAVSAGSAPGLAIGDAA